MYNLIVGFIDGVASADRLLEYTDDVARQYVAPSGALDVSRLVNLPALVMPELQDTQSPQVARVGDVADLTLVGRDYRFRFLPNPAVPVIASDRIEKASRWLQISDWEFNRHHWAVKNVDLYRVLHESIRIEKLPNRRSVSGQLRRCCQRDHGTSSQRAPAPEPAMNDWSITPVVGQVELSIARHRIVHLSHPPAARVKISSGHIRRQLRTARLSTPSK